ncbi:MAG TPA: RES family NAD+ phosphorylase [Xanthomonadales bacterium]|nr:RES family NAD+ phosphorylase [Xanthomonadales bacterium]
MPPAKLPRPLRRVRRGQPFRAWSLCPTIDLEDGSCDSSARWHSAGRRVLYVADSPSGALLEARVHLLAHPSRLPRGWRLHEISVPASASVAELSRASLPPRWKRRQRWSRALGDAWHASGASAVLRVPSALVDDACNYVLNLEHPALARLRVVDGDEHVFDPRLFKALARPGKSRSM